MKRASHSQGQKFLPKGDRFKDQNQRESSRRDVAGQNHAAVLSETLRQVISFCKCESFDAAQHGSCNEGCGDNEVKVRIPHPGATGFGLTENVYVYGDDEDEQNQQNWTQSGS